MTLASHLFNGADFLLCLIAISAAWLGARYDKKRDMPHE